MFGQRYDRVYKSKIFTFSPDNNFPWECDVIKGGSGYDNCNLKIIGNRFDNPELISDKQ